MKLKFILLIMFASAIAFAQDTLHQDLIYESDTAGLRNVGFGQNIPIGSFNILSGNTLDTYTGSFYVAPYNSGLESNDGSGNFSSIGVAAYGNQLFSFSNTMFSSIQILPTNLILRQIYNQSNSYGTELSLGATTYFKDSRPVKKGLQYSNNGYVTTATSLTDKQYVDLHQLTKYSKGSLPSANPSGRLIFVTDATGGAVPAYSDNSNWRRVTDGTIIN